VLKRAKLFRNGRSQAVRIPAEFRMEGSEVYIRYDASSKQLILSPRPESWQDFFEMADTMQLPKDFLGAREDHPPQKRSSF
jgi:antitoxin VapB